jgi:glutaredoxin
MDEFYFANWSLHCREAKKLIEKSGLNVKVIDLTNLDDLAMHAEDFFRRGGPSQLPALIIPEERVCYEGLNQIRAYLKEKDLF